MLELELVQRLGLSGFILELLPQREDRELPLSLLPQRLLLLLPDIRNNLPRIIPGRQARGGKGGREGIKYSE